MSRELLSNSIISCIRLVVLYDDRLQVYFKVKVVKLSTCPIFFFFGDPWRPLWKAETFHSAKEMLAHENQEIFPTNNQPIALTSEPVASRRSFSSHAQFDNVSWSFNVIVMVVWPCVNSCILKNIICGLAAGFCHWSSGWYSYVMTVYWHKPTSVECYLTIVC